MKCKQCNGKGKLRGYITLHETGYIDCPECNRKQMTSKYKGDNMKWLTINEYAKQQGLTVQAIYYRIDKGNIPESRIRKGESGKIEIRIEE